MVTSEGGGGVITMQEEEKKADQNKNTVKSMIEGIRIYKLEQKIPL